MSLIRFSVLTRIKMFRIYNACLMFSYRITKYNPQHRTSTGAYRKNEWTSIYDIGHLFEREKFTYKQYKQVEDAYVAVILFFMDFLKQKTLYVTALEKNSDSLIENSRYSKKMTDLHMKLSVGMQVNCEEIDGLVRLALRQDLWCKLESEKMYAHFGDDYYMFVGSASISDLLIEKIEKLGLFVEEFESPYHEDMTEEDIIN